MAMGCKRASLRSGACRCLCLRLHNVGAGFRRGASLTRERVLWAFAYGETQADSIWVALAHTYKSRMCVRVVLIRW